MTSFDRITIAARVFSVAAILGLVLLSGDLQALRATIMLAVLAASSSAVSAVARVPPVWISLFEASFVALLAGMLLPASSGLLLMPYLAVPALSAGLSSRARGLAAVLGTEAASLFLLASLIPSSSRSLELAAELASWLLTSTGIGLLGVWLSHFTDVMSGTSESYEAARRLMDQLRTVTRRLPAGLDTGTLAVHLLTLVTDELTAEHGAVFVRTEGGRLSPLGYLGEGRDSFSPDEPTVMECWVEGEPVVAAKADGCLAYLVALPLRAGSRLFGVVIAEVAEKPSKDQLRAVMEPVDRHGLALDTALTFDELRSDATREERRRLAREIHDGVAQEVASLGYLVDEAAAQAESEQLKTQLRSLRFEVTRIVGELRHSIFELRSETSSSAGLGNALTEYVREVGARYGITVHLKLEESSTRLRSEVETELLRIAQEAITNARKHSRARNLWVDCAVQPPFARISVRDDGLGFREPRQDSYGLKIMRERAARVDATLEITPGDARRGSSGTKVVVTVGTAQREQRPARMGATHGRQ